MAEKASIAVPARWSVTRYRGVPATVVFPLVFVSNWRLTGRCVSGPPNRNSCATDNWFPPGVRVPPSGVLAMLHSLRIPNA